MHETSLEIGAISAMLIVTLTPGLIALEQYVRENFYYAHATIKYTLAVMLAYALIV
jgi:hypothetical protein